MYQNSKQRLFHKFPQLKKVNVQKSILVIKIKKYIETKM